MLDAERYGSEINRARVSSNSLQFSEPVLDNYPFDVNWYQYRKTQAHSCANSLSVNIKEQLQNRTLYFYTSNSPVQNIIKMSPSRTIMETVLVLASYSLVLGLSIVSPPSTISAGTNFDLQITNDFSHASGEEKAYTDFTIYLSISPVSNSSNESCSLQPHKTYHPINTTSVTVTIPPTIGGNGSGYRFAVIPWTVDPQNNSSTYPGPAIFSHDFDIERSGASWSEGELDSCLGAFGFDVLPCSAYDCARGCCDGQYPAALSTSLGCPLRETFECVMACPETSFPEEHYEGCWDEMQFSFRSFVTPSTTAFRLPRRRQQLHLLYIRRICHTQRHLSRLQQ